MKNFHGYATLKTSGQLVMDLGSVTTHIAGLIAFLKNGNTESTLGQFFLWFLVGVIIFQVWNTSNTIHLKSQLFFIKKTVHIQQVIVAVGLYIFRWLDLNEEVNHRTAYRWNIIFFVAVFLTSICEAFLGIFEKFGLEHGPGAVNGTSLHWCLLIILMHISLFLIIIYFWTYLLKKFNDEY